MRYKLTWTLSALLGAAAFALLLAPPAAAQGRDCYEEKQRTVVRLNPFTGLPTVVTETYEEYDTSCNTIRDGRVNAADPAAKAAIYCRANGGVDIYDLDFSGNGTFALRATAAEVNAVPARPATNTLIDSVPGFALYRLTTGELQLNGPFDYQGNQYVYIWNGCG